MSGGDKMDAKIVLYGAGKRGRALYRFLKMLGEADIIYGFCDREWEKISAIDNKKIYSPMELKEDNIKYYITIADNVTKNDVIQKLGKENCIEFMELADHLHIDRVEFERDYCAFMHIDNMDGYFEKAEKEEYLDVFWNLQSVFYKMFCRLDLTNVIELACGRGRHVPFYKEKAEVITLVDILQKNIDICKNRFYDVEKIKYYKNDGYDLSELGSNLYSALFSYDAMVHFELIDIYLYLQDIYRVLKPGGRAFLHHSNYSIDPKAAFGSTPHGRSFMSKECFAYLAYRAGFNILEQETIDWDGTLELDCLTLIEKPID